MSRDYMGKAEFEDETRAAGRDETHRCPICDEEFQPDDNCATDIELGTCHFECLDGSPIVDLETGEEILDDDMHSFPYSEVMDPLAPAPSDGPTYLDFITPDEIFDKGPAAVKQWQDAKRAEIQRVAIHDDAEVPTSE